MTYTLKELINTCNENSAEINGKWVPARPINYKYSSLKEKLKECWLVLRGKVDTVIWPGGQ